jgi:hypothetical protein
MGLGITNALVLEPAKVAMKTAISTKLLTYYDTLETVPSTKEEYASKFAEVLADTIFDTLIPYISTHANITALGGVLPPAPVNPTTITVTPTITLL